MYSQMQFCQTAGCNATDAKLTNFCETKYMGTACSCSKGASRLEQYQWPVMLADCWEGNGGVGTHVSSLVRAWGIRTGVWECARILWQHVW